MTRRERRVDRWVEDLLHDRSPRALRGADAEDQEALRAAIELRSAPPGAGMPDPHFVEQLWHRIGRETQGELKPRSGLSRRGLLLSGGAAAAAAAAGLVVGDRLATGDAPARDLVPDAGGWLGVADLAQVPPGTAMRFTTAAVQGFVTNRNGMIEAVSATCTHLGCILRLNPGAARLDCPCHNASFAFDGSVLFHSLPQQLAPLPRLQSRVRDGRIEVFTV
jgi:cytochrome b6-f complex iron-sulfur subunit